MKPPLTPLEKHIVSQSTFDADYSSTENITTLILPNFKDLGKFTALRFIEWVQQNPGGVVSLPTGKTPEYFIKWTKHYLKHWNKKEIQKELESLQISHNKKPEMSSLQFVQIDEFYPINSKQTNSFLYYIKKFYFSSLGLDASKAQIIDCNKIGLASKETLESVWPGGYVDLDLRYRSAENEKEKRQKQLIRDIDEWCQEYEDAIRQKGGIGFFLGGIGPDGHIGFNVQGSDHHSTTRLTKTNYMTQAAAAVDLGGIEISSKRLVITIGLETITYNEQCAALIIAAGESKANVVRDAIESEKSVNHPATALHQLPGARFYITKGASKLLQARNIHLLKNSKTLDTATVDRLIIDLAIDKRKHITSLTKTDFEKDPYAEHILHKTDKPIKELCQQTYDAIIEKIKNGSSTKRNVVFYHTEPHHDDLMLGCLPFIVRHTREPQNIHHFAYITSGFTSVTNHFMSEHFEILEKYIHSDEFKKLFSDEYFSDSTPMKRNRDVWQYLDGVAAQSNDSAHNGISRRLLRDIISLYAITEKDTIAEKIAELKEYFKTQYPGKKDIEKIQILKGMRREWEAECLWGYFGWNTDNVHHLRLGFYTGDIFNDEPEYERDIKPIVDHLTEFKPDVVTVAFDPEASGPDTHHKALQAIKEAVKIYVTENRKENLIIWGYRNVWYTFHPSEVDIIVPVSLNMFSIMNDAFKNSFLSQRDASFPSYRHNGPFSELAQHIQVSQYQAIKTCLGRGWFYEHPSALIRATRGLVYLKEMNWQEFYDSE